MASTVPTRQVLTEARQIFAGDDDLLMVKQIQEQKAKLEEAWEKEKQECKALIKGNVAGMVIR